MRTRTWKFISRLVLLVATSFCVAQEQREAPFSLRTGVDLVLVPVTLMNRRGAMVTDLERSHFAVLQDNNPQPIVSFSKENLPCTLAIVLDTSGSMGHQLSLAKSVTSGVLAMSEPQDEAFLTSVSDKPEVNAPLTTDAASVQSLLPYIKSGGSTALVDTVFLALTQLRKAHNPRKALLILSDGMDNNSRHSKSELLRTAIEADVQIYTVSIGTISRTAKPISLREEREGLAFLSDLAAMTGGLHYTVEFPADTERISSELGHALRDQYIIGYIPARSDNPRKWHTIQVKLDVPKITVYSRRGYYSR